MAPSSEHIDALADFMHDMGCGCDTGASGETKFHAAGILQSDRLDVHAALLDALFRHGVLEWEAPMSSPHMRRLVAVEWVEA